VVDGPVENAFQVAIDTTFAKRQGATVAGWRDNRRINRNFGNVSAGSARRFDTVCVICAPLMPVRSD